MTSDQKKLQAELERVGGFGTTDAYFVQFKAPLFHRDRVVIAEHYESNGAGLAERGTWPKLRWEGAVRDAIARLAPLPAWQREAGPGVRYPVEGFDGKDTWRRMWLALDPDLAQRRFTAEDEREKYFGQLREESKRQAEAAKWWKK